MTGWNWSTIGGCCDITSGGTPSKSNPSFWKGDLPFVSARDLKTDHIEKASLHISPEAVEKSSVRIAPVGSLLMLVRGMGLANGIQIGEVISPVAFNQDIRAIHPPRTLLPRFLLLALRNSFLNGDGERALSSAAHGTLKIDSDALRGMAIPLPPLPEQQRIVGILDEAFAAIATAKANTEKNLRNARALFESHVKAALTRSGNSWQAKRLDELCTFSSGGTPSKHNNSYWNGDVPWISGRDMKSTRLSDSFLHISRSAVAESSTRMAPAGSLLILVRGMGLAHGAQIGELMVPCAFNQDIRAIHPASELMPRFLLFALRERINTSDTVLSSAAHGTLKIDSDELQQVVIHYPPRAIQERLVAAIDSISEETQRLESLYQQKLAALAALKSSLLHQALSGQLASSTLAVAPSQVLKPAFAISPALPLARFPGLPPGDLHAAVLVMAFRLHEKHGNTQEFGHVKAEKIAHMIEARLGIELGRKPVKDAAGPLDFEQRRWVDKHANTKKWFKFEDKGGHYEFRIRERVGFILSHTEMMLGNRMAEVNALLQWMLPMAWREAEIVATVFAAWNNLLLDGKQPTDEEIVYESRENWHKEKLKIKRELFFEAIAKMRKDGVVPEGKWKRVEAKAVRVG